MFDFVVGFFYWFWSVSMVAGVLFSLLMFYWCLKGYIAIHFPSDDEVEDDGDDGGLFA